jgi:hypothetical protein
MLREHGILKISASKAELRTVHFENTLLWGYPPKYSIATPQKKSCDTDGYPTGTRQVSQEKNEKNYTGDFFF